MLISEITDLSELRGVKRDLSSQPVDELLYSHGFNQIGEGAFATVWEHPKLNYVLKIFSSDDTSYLQWVKVAQANKNNPHIPRFVSAKPIRITDDWFAMRMERLTPLSYNKYGQMIDEIYILVATARSVPPSKSFIEHITQSINTVKTLHNVREYAESHPHFVEAIALLATAIRQYNLIPDIKTSNLMLRGNDLVFTDPVV